MPDERVMVMERAHFEGGASFLPWPRQGSSFMQLGAVHSALLALVEISERWLQDRWGQYAIFRRGVAARFIWSPAGVFCSEYMSLSLR